MFSLFLNSYKKDWDLIIISRLIAKLSFTKEILQIHQRVYVSRFFDLISTILNFFNIVNIYFRRNRAAFSRLWIQSLQLYRLKWRGNSEQSEVLFRERKCRQIHLFYKQLWKSNVLGMSWWRICPNKWHIVCSEYETTRKQAKSIFLWCLS